MKFIAAASILFLLSLFSESVQTQDDFTKFATESGYKSEVHEVETEDGYLLTLHRILPIAENSTKIPVFLMHGLLATSGDFIVAGKDEALGFLLADNGYDVWLGNSRGNKYSTRHVNLSTESPEYWNFSWHEIGFYDLPAMIDYMLNHTSSSKAFYVGHSQGTTSAMVLLSTRPEYNEKLVQVHLLSPVIFMKNFPHKWGKTFKSEIERGVLDDYSYLNLKPIYDLTNSYRDNFCIDKSQGFYCPGLVVLIFVLLGANRQGVEMDTDIFKRLNDHLSPRASVNQFKHYFQLAYTKHFEEFRTKDRIYEDENELRYPLENVKTSVYLYHGAEDLLLDISDVKRLKEILLNVTIIKVIPNYNHSDFNYGKNSKKIVHRNILEAFNKFRHRRRRERREEGGE